MGNVENIKFCRKIPHLSQQRLCSASQCNGASAGEGMMDTWPMILEKGEKIYVGVNGQMILFRCSTDMVSRFYWALFHALFPKYHSKIPETSCILHQTEGYASDVLRKLSSPVTFYSLPHPSQDKAQ